MKVEIGVDEAVALASVVRPLPPMVAAVRGRDDAVEVDIDLDQVPGLTGAQRLVARLAGTVTVVARLTGFTDGVATLDLDVVARGIPVEKVAGLLAARLTQALEDQGLPRGAVVLSQGPTGLTATAQVRTILAEHVDGVRVVALDLRAGTIHAEIEVAQR